MDDTFEDDVYIVVLLSKLFYFRDQLNKIQLILMRLKPFFIYIIFDDLVYGICFF